MSWPGWETFVPGGVALKAKLSRGARMHAKPAIVDDGLNVVEKSQAEAFGVKGLYFHSMKEARRFVLLRRYEEVRAIAKLSRQTRFPLQTMNTRGERVTIGVYVADVVYEEDGRTVIEDVKGPARREDLYLWKKRHLRAQYGLEIREV